jgi:phosphoribosylaminoimidazole-succinocarboxamide synthase
MNAPGRGPLLESRLEGVKLLGRGKVRDIYEVESEGDVRLLIVATDRISAFDVIMPTPIPDKGAVLTALSLFWFGRLGDIIPNHLVTANVNEYPAALRPFREQLEGRSMLVERAAPLPVECVVRGYLAGSGWEDYRRTQAICGIMLPKGLVESQKLMMPLFTPASKAEQGEHDQNISYVEVEDLVGENDAHGMRKVSLEIYEEAAEFAQERGIIIADTKFEFGRFGENNQLMLIDEVLTPDSSRFWPADGYAPGRPQKSFDKQYLRDWLTNSGWNRKPPAPQLPEEVVQNTRERYLEALKRLTGKGLE